MTSTILPLPGLDAIEPPRKTRHLRRQRPRKGDLLQPVFARRDRVGRRLRTRGRRSPGRPWCSLRPLRRRCRLSRGCHRPMPTTISFCYSNSPASLIASAALAITVRWPPPRMAAALLTAQGTVEGRILSAPRGSGGFGYDPLFYLPALDTHHGGNRRSDQMDAIATADRLFAPYWNSWPESSTASNRTSPSRSPKP